MQVLELATRSATVISLVALFIEFAYKMAKVRSIVHERCTG